MARRLSGWDQSAGTVIGAWAVFRYLLQDGITRQVYVKWYGLEDRVEWRKQLENSALLGLDAGKPLLERLCQLVLSLKELYAEESGSMSSFSAESIGLHSTTVNVSSLLLIFSSRACRRSVVTVRLACIIVTSRDCTGSPIFFWRED